LATEITPAMATKPKSPKIRAKLTDGYLETLAAFREGGDTRTQEQMNKDREARKKDPRHTVHNTPHETKVIWDTNVRQLRVTIGKHRTTFSYFQQHRQHGKRSSTVEVLGHWPAMNVDDARKEAQKIAGRNASGRIAPGKRKAVKFSEAFAEYLSHLEAKAANKGKPPRWHGRVVSLGNVLLPEFGKWPLADLSHSPAAVRDFHARMTKENGPVSANRAMQVLRAAYKHASKLNRSLPPALPTSAVLWNVERPAQKGLLDFDAWTKAWRAIELPSRRAFVLCNLLTGARRGELARVTREHIDLKKRTLTFRNAKGGRDYVVPLSSPIVRCLRHVDGFESAWHNPVRDGLPAYGHALRHAYASTARGLGVDPLLVKILMGHSLGSSDVTEVYMSSEMLRVPLRAAQRRISAELLKLLGLGAAQY
jgi:integrase